MAKTETETTDTKPKRGRKPSTERAIMDGKMPFSVVFRQTPSNDVYAIIDGANHAESARDKAAEIVGKAGGVVYVLSVTAILVPPERPAAKELPLW